MVFYMYNKLENKQRNIFALRYLQRAHDFNTMKYGYKRTVF